MKTVGRYSERGASVVEMLIVLVIIGILTAFAVARFGMARDNFDRRNIAREFKVSLERARFDSVKRHANVCTDMSGVTVNTTSFSLMTDMNQDGTLQTSESRQINIAERSDVTIVPNGVTLPFTVRFDERGRAYINDCSAGSTPTAEIPLLYFCNGVCTVGTANAENSSVIFVSPSGTVAMLDGGSGMPTFDDPTVSSQTDSSNINPDLLVSSGAGSTPAPTASPTGSPLPGTPTPTPPSETPTPTPPSGTPTPTATPTPTGTPTATPTPTPLPTATATPPSCPTVAPWGVPPACTCNYPQRVRRNGECK